MSVIIIVLVIALAFGYFIDQNSNNGGYSASV